MTHLIIQIILVLVAGYVSKLLADLIKPGLGTAVGIIVAVLLTLLFIL